MGNSHSRDTASGSAQSPAPSSGQQQQQQPPPAVQFPSRKPPLAPGSSSVQQPPARASPQQHGAPQPQPPQPHAQHPPQDAAHVASYAPQTEVPHYQPHRPAPPIPLSAKTGPFQQPHAHSVPPPTSIYHHTPGANQAISSVLAAINRALALQADGSIITTTTSSSTHQITLLVHEEHGDREALPLDAATGTVLCASSSHAVCATPHGQVFVWAEQQSQHNQPPPSHSPELGPTYPSIPSLLSGLERIQVASIGCGRGHTVFATVEGVVYTIGENTQGQCGVAECTQVTTPTRIVYLSDSVAQVACGESHSVLLTEGGRVLACGDSSMGQVGSGQLVASVPKFVHVLGLDARPINKIACGNQFSCALTYSGMVYVWGGSAHGLTAIGINYRPSSAGGPRGAGLSTSMANLERSRGDSVASLSRSASTVLTSSLSNSADDAAGSGSGIALPHLVRTLVGSQIIDIACGADHLVCLDRQGTVRGFGLVESGLLRSQLVEPYSSTPSASNLVHLDSSSHGGDALEALAIASGESHVLVLARERSSGAQRLLVTSLVTRPEFAGEADDRGNYNGRNGDWSTVTLESLVASAAAKAGSNAISHAISPSVHLPHTWHATGAPALEVTRLVAAGAHSFVTVRELAAAVASSPQTLPQTLGSWSRHDGVPVHKSLVTLEMEVVSRLWQAQQWPALDLLLGKVFSEPACMCGSFLSAANPQSTALFAGVDMQAVRAFYDLMLHDRTPTTTRVLLERLIVDLLTRMLVNWPQDTQEVLRVWPIILDHPMLIGNPAARPAVNRMSSVLRSSGKYTHTVLQYWWAHYSTESFTRLVALFNYHLGLELVAMQSPGPTVQLTIDIMRELYELNHHRNIIPHQHFHNPVVNEFLRAGNVLFLDYINWLEHSNTFSYCRYPFLLTPFTKSLIVKMHAMMEQREKVTSALIQSFFSTVHTTSFMLTVRREFLLNDVLAQLMRAPDAQLKMPLRVVFHGEEGIDAGGVRKEFFQLVIRSLFDPSFGMFVINKESNTYWFSPDTLEANTEFELVGLILGLAIYNDVLLPVQFPLVVWRKLLGANPTLDDLRELDPPLGRNLQLLLDYQGGDEQDAFEMTFEITREVYGETRLVPLVLNGASIPVTKDNKQAFVDAYVRYLLVDSVVHQFGAFARGFLRVAGGPFLQLLRAEDLQRIINGSGEESIDTTELERITRYERGFTASHPSIVQFWEIVHSLSEEEKRRFLSFSTGSDRIPIGGLSSVQFIIRRASGDTEHLPTASTCFNILHLPQYSSKEKMRQKLLVAINNAEGFGLV